jgi:glutamine synthetase
MEIPFSMQERRDVMKAVKDYNVSFLQYWFVDILARSRASRSHPRTRGLLEEGMGFDGSSILGFCRIDESDMVAIPDPTTFPDLRLAAH